MEAENSAKTEVKPPVSMTSICQGCSECFSNTEYKAHFDSCEKLERFSHAQKAMFWNDYLYRLHTFQAEQLVKTLDFSNYTLSEGQQYPNVPCHCETNGEHPQLECLRKLGEPEMRTKGTELIRQAMEYYKKYEEHRIETVCEESNLRQNFIFNKYFPEMTEKALAEMIGTGYHAYISNKELGPKIHKLVIQMNRKNTAIETAAENIATKTENWNKLLEVQIADRVAKNAATLKKWETRNEQNKGSKSKRSASQSSSSTASKRPRRK
uniref:C2H2-type domain-containing protein n=1 Tax=Caenorhabditis tropicalis TaxID=1561998 RepID=A0A1I7V3H6_9PELO